MEPKGGSFKNSIRVNNRGLGGYMGHYDQFQESTSKYEEEEEKQKELSENEQLLKDLQEVVELRYRLRKALKKLKGEGN